MGEKNKRKNGGEPENNVTVVLKADLHCEGCITKVLKCIRSYDGVDNASVGEGLRITVVGKVDPAKLKQRVESKTHKKVELVSPLVTKKDEIKNDGKKGDAKGKDIGGGGGGDDTAGTQEKKEEDDNSSKQSNSVPKKKTEQKKPPHATAVLKVHLHCEGCIQKICKLVAKTKGYEDVKIDRRKELVTVTGAMDMTALAQLLKKHLKREVEILPPPQPPKKEGNQKKSGGGGNSKAEGGGDNAKNGKEKGENGKDKKRKESGGGGEGGEMAEGGGGEKMEGYNGNNNRVQFQVGYPNPYPYPYPCVYEAGVLDQFRYNLYTFGPYNAPQMFSDENPNACTVM